MSDKLSPHLREVYTRKLIHGPQLLLMVLYNRTCEGRTPSNVAELTGMEPATISMAKKLLKKQEYIEVVFPARDGRTALMRLTASGAKEARLLWSSLRGLTKNQAAFYKVSPSHPTSRASQKRNRFHRVD